MFLFYTNNFADYSRISEGAHVVLAARISEEERRDAILLGHGRLRSIRPNASTIRAYVAQAERHR
jgi:hypothetical protein